MRVIVQRVTKASVTVASTLAGAINAGLLVLVGIEETDNEEDIEWLSNKLVNLRIFSDAGGLMNKSLLENNGELLLISQFTLFASVKKGNRPSFSRAAPPAIALPLFEQLHQKLGILLCREVPTGVFGADMQVALINDGPVTIVIDSKQRDF
jgi:D-aminoacyl-tRNA deacylase